MIHYPILDDLQYDTFLTTVEDISSSSFLNTFMYHVYIVADDCELSHRAFSPFIFDIHDVTYVYVLGHVIMYVTMHIYSRRPYLI